MDEKQLQDDLQELESAGLIQSYEDGTIRYVPMSLLAARIASANDEANEWNAACIANRQAEVIPTVQNSSMEPDLG